MVIMEQAVSLVAPAPLPAAGGAAVAVALVADAMDYGRLRAVGLCGPADYGRYLREAERQLRGIDGQGVAVHLRVLEPVDYLDYCMVRGLRPGAPAAQVAYAADPQLAGEPFVYAGQRMAQLLPALVDDHLARVRLTVALAELAGRPGARAAVRVAERLYDDLLSGLGEGCHRLLLRWARAEQRQVAEHEARVAGGRRVAGERQAEAFRALLAAGLASGARGELLTASTGPARSRAAPRHTVRGWRLACGGLAPLAVEELRVLLARLPDRRAGLVRPGCGPVRIRAGFGLGCGSGVSSGAGE
ncbi:hypothetical protein P3T35_007027 [Kitasatospora sp. GP30]|uniref:hypothetical protein n=1 Tax=Kitasatospora sp. GP30 TaxID=3035084 RepID=UPI00117D95E8|nr:hypothetical protein [Kitasatospora sp. GP30]MDH6144977.1 hypothetical protein [Kitasatospora sp. GP30]